MRIPSGVTDQYIYFVAVDATDLKTRETGLATWTVYRSRNGGAAAAFTTPTINETDSVNMPGVYELLLDEDMTIDAGDYSQEMVFHITHAGMAPVTRTIELYRPKITAGETLTVSSGNGNAAVQSIAAGAITASAIATGAVDADALAADAVAEIADGVWDEDATGHQTQGTFGQAIGDPVADANTIYKAVVTDASGATVGVDSTAILEDTGTTLQAELDGIQADTEDIQARLPAALTAGGNIKADALAVSGDTVAADTLELFAEALDQVTGQVDNGTFAASAIDANAIAADAIGSSELAASAVTEIQSGLSTLDAAGVRTAVGLASANLDTQLDALPTANENADALLDRSAGVETNRTLRQALRLMLAVLCGKVSGLATTTATFRDTNDGTNRVVATVDADGNRTAVTYDAS